MRRIFVLLAVALVMFFVALGAGLLEYRGNPRGVFIYTPRNFCSQPSHSFTVGVTFVVLAEALGAFLVGLAALIAARVPRWRSTQASLRRVSSNAFWVLLCLVGLWFTHPIFEYLHPLQVDPNCHELAP